MNNEASHLRAQRISPNPRHVTGGSHPNGPKGSPNGPEGDGWAQLLQGEGTRLGEGRHPIIPPSRASISLHVPACCCSPKEIPLFPPRGVTQAGTVPHPIWPEGGTVLQEACHKTWGTLLPASSTAGTSGKGLEASPAWLSALPGASWHPVPSRAEKSPHGALAAAPPGRQD